MTYAKMLLSSVLSTLVLVGCADVAVTEPLALPATPAAYRHAAPAGAPATVPALWWNAFADARLDQLEDRAMARNTSLQAAAARLARARALVRQAGAAQWPQLGLGASTARAGGGFYRAQGEAGDLHQLRLDASFEVDVMGRLSKASQAARLDAQAAQALLADARLLVQADVAQAYFSLRAIDAERTVVRDTVGAYRETLQLIERRRAAGDVGDLDVARVRTEVAATEAQALALDRRRQELETALAVLVGDLPGDLGIAEGLWPETLPTVPAGLPSSLLARRPDVVAAQASYRAAQARLGVAQTAWFPSISLTAAAGGASPELADLFKGSAGFWGLNALLSLPVFDGGRREAGVESAAAQADEVAAAYRERVLLAFKDVEDQLANLALLDAQGQAQAEAVGSAQRALALSNIRYRNGLVSQLELLDSRRTELANRRQALQVRAARYQATVALIKALGGSWS